MRKLLPAVIAIILCFSSCEKSHLLPGPMSNTNTILIDASKDGGVWWYPQSGDFSANASHQGQALANYLRKMGFDVVEVPRGQVIKWSYLSQFRKVIRFVGFGTYTQQEIDAYDSLAAHSASILFIQDHLQNASNDNLSAHWGLNFSGSVTATISQLAPHPITNGVSSLNFDAGSVILNPDANRITVLGSFSVPNYQQAAIGILHHPSSKIVFMGDGNGIELTPQPFTDNLVHWLFQ
jgi:hypothetical protein